MKRLVLFVLSALAASAVSAPAPFVKPHRKTDLEKVQGEWMVHSSQEWVRDNVCKKRIVPRAFVIISGDRYDWHERGHVYADVIRLDSAKTPKAIDLKRTDSTRVWKGIYVLEDDVLTIFDERPASFASSRWGDEEYVLRRR
jgi:uncharacterized protein (TIGR03067 family)